MLKQIIRIAIGFITLPVKVSAHILPHETEKNGFMQLNWTDLIAEFFKVCYILSELKLTISNPA